MKPTLWLLSFSLLGAVMLADGEPGGSAPGGLVIDSLRRAAAARIRLLADWPGIREPLERSEESALALRPDPAGLAGAAAALEEARRQAVAGLRPWEDVTLLERLGDTTATPQSPPLACWPEWLPAGVANGELGIPAEVQAPENSTGTEVEIPARADIEQVRLSGKDLQDQVLMHVFEKVETADEYRGGTRQTDGDDQLEEQLEALQ